MGFSLRPLFIVVLVLDPVSYSNKPNIRYVYNARETMPSNRAIPPEISQEISRRLAGAEHEHKVRILYCCESGSRAWGFASADSDYDVRFIYVHEEDWYLSFDIERRRDVIEYPIIDEIDCSGWDLRKALYLFTRTNGALLEWLNSPVRYIERGNFAKKLRDLAPRVINNMALCYHYSHMARRNAREYLFRDKVKLKKYFYVLRPLLAIRYIEEGRGIPRWNSSGLLRLLPRWKFALVSPRFWKQNELPRNLALAIRFLQSMLLSLRKRNDTAPPFMGKDALTLMNVLRSLKS